MLHTKDSLVWPFSGEGEVGVSLPLNTPFNWNQTTKSYSTETAVECAAFQDPDNDILHIEMALLVTWSLIMIFNTYTWQANILATWQPHDICWWCKQGPKWWNSGNMPHLYKLLKVLIVLSLQSGVWCSDSIERHGDGHGGWAGQTILSARSHQDENWHQRGPPIPLKLPD